MCLAGYGVNWPALKSSVEFSRCAFVGQLLSISTYLLKYVLNFEIVTDIKI